MVDSDEISGANFERFLKLFIIEETLKEEEEDKEGHYIMIKVSIQEEGRTIVTIYAPNIRAPQYIKQILTVIKGEIDSNTITVGAFNTPLSTMDRYSK